MKKTQFLIIENLNCFKKIFSIWLKCIYLIVFDMYIICKLFVLKQNFTSTMDSYCFFHAPSTL